MPKLLPRLSVALRFLRQALGWSATELADALDVSSNLISDYETGRKTLTRERLEQLIAPLGLSRDAIDDALAFLDRVGTPGSPGGAHVVLPGRREGDRHGPFGPAPGRIPLSGAA